MDAQEPEVDFTKLPIEERCQHKNWKARLSGYEDLLKLFQQADDEKAPEFAKYAPMVRKIPVDSIAAAQEKGLATVQAFVEMAAPQVSARVSAEVLAGIVTKCLISSKAKTKELAAEIVLMYVEVERQETVVEELSKGLENKSPKIVQACITLLKDALNQFGPKVIKPSPLIKIVQSKIEDRDKNVREETKLLAIELYRWLKEAFRPQIANLKDVVLTELDAEFEKIKEERPQVQRYLRSEQVLVQVTANNCEAETDGQAASVPIQEDVDPFELLEPVEILNKLPEGFYTLCESKKWQERKQAIESLQELLTPNPKLAAGDYGDLVKVLRKMIGKDTNINVVASSAKALADLASRLRKAFHQYAHATIAIILEKFKEKKQNVVVALREAIDACMLSTSLEVIQEDIVAALDNKNPQIKAETASFLTRQFAISTPSVVGNKKLLKVLLAALIKTLNDMDGTVRDASAEAIGTASKVNGEKLMAPFLADVDAIKMTKIKEFSDKAEVKYPAPPGGHAPPRPAPTKVVSASNLPARPGSGGSSAQGSLEDLSRPSATNGRRPVAAKTTTRPATGLRKNTSAPSVGTKNSTTMTRPKTSVAAKTVTRAGGRPSTGGVSATRAAAPSPVEPEEPPPKTVQKVPTSAAKSRLPAGARPGLKPPGSKLAAPSGLRPPGAANGSRAIPAPAKPQLKEALPPSSEEEEEIVIETYDAKLKEKAEVSRSLTITKRRSLSRPTTLNKNNVENIEEELPQSPVKEQPPILFPAHLQEGMSVAQKIALVRQQKAANRQQPLVPHNQQHQTPMSAHQYQGSILDEMAPEDLIINANTDILIPENRVSKNGSDLGQIAKMVSCTDKEDMALNIVIAQLSGSDIPSTIEAFAQLNELISRPEQARQYLSPKVDQIVLLCAMQYRMCVSKYLVDDRVPREQVIDLFKSTTSLLDSLFKHQTLRKQATTHSLRELMPQTISIILEPRLAESQSGPAVIKAVNMLATCIIINADPTNMMCALVQLLVDSIKGITVSSRFTEMVMKCIWKMVRFIDQYYAQMNIDKVLGEVHVFMKQFPSDYWKGKSDTPLRTVKTITYLLVQHKGQDILNCLSEIPDPNGAELVVYINRALKQIARQQQAAAQAQNGQQVNNSINQVNGDNCIAAGAANGANGTD